MSAKLAALKRAIASQGAGGGFNPADYGSLFLHLDASQAGDFTFDSGTDVDTWADRSGNGNDFATYSTGYPDRSLTQNGLSVVDFTAASSQAMHAGDVGDMGTAHRTVFVVMRIDITTNNMGIYGKSVAAATDGRWGLVRFDTGKKLVALYDEGAALQAESTPTDTNWHVVMMEIDRTTGAGNADVRLYVDDSFVDEDPFLEDGVDYDIGGYLWLGAYGDGAGTTPFPGYYLDGKIAEVIDYQDLISSGDRTTVHDHLATKWGI